MTKQITSGKKYKIKKLGDRYALLKRILETEKYFWEIVMRYEDYEDFGCEDFGCSSDDRVDDRFRNICRLSAN